MRKLVLRIKNQNTPFYRFLYQIAKKVFQFSVPCFPIFHGFLYNEWCLRTSVWHNFLRVIYYEPIFKSQCASVGKNFRMEYAGNGSAKIMGNLSINIGENVCVFDNTIFVGLKIMDRPELSIGDNSYIAPLVRFMVADRISIGTYCMIGARVITDNPGHSAKDVLARMTSGGGSPPKNAIRPVTIGDFCWLALDTVVYPGVTIGDGVVATLGTHISKDVPPFCQVAGNPMRIIRKLPIPEELIKIVGEDRFNFYLRAHDNLEL